MLTPIFTSDDIKTFQDMIDDCVTTIGGEGIKRTNKTRQNGRHIEVSLDKGGKHLALIEMVAHRNYSKSHAPIEAIVFDAYRMIDRHNEYKHLKRIIRKFE